MDALGVADSPKARDIQQTIADAERRYDALQESVVEKQHRVNDAYVSHVIVVSVVTLSSLILDFFVRITAVQRHVLWY